MAFPPIAARQAWRAERAARQQQDRTPRIPLTVRAARLLARVLPRWAVLRTLVLSLAGFGCLTYAAFQWTPIAGWIAAGVSCLAIEALSGGER